MLGGGVGIGGEFTVGSGIEFFLGNMVVYLICYLCLTKWFIMFDLDRKIWYLC